MNWQRAICILLLLLQISCSSDRHGESGPDFIENIPVSGEADPELTITLDPQGILAVSSHNIGSSGLNASIPAPAGLLSGQIFSGSGPGYLSMAAENNGRLEICIAPLPEFQPGAINLELSPLNLEPKQTSISVRDNRIRDLVVERTPDNFYRLSWTAINLGDYDHNGEVNIADLIPLAQHYHARAPLDQPWTRLNPLFWVDGDGNNEINIADLTVIARNFGNSLDHYDLTVKGVLLQQINYKQAVSLPGSGLPRRFSVLVSTESAAFEQEFALTPVSYSGSITGPSSTSLTNVELSSRSSFFNLNLLSQCQLDKQISAGSFFAPDIVDLADCYEVFRLINPIDDFDFEPPIDIPQPFGSAMFNGLKREKLCYLESAFLPANDPATGQPNVSAGPDSPGIYRIAYPLRLPDDGRSYETSMNISAVASPDGGSYLDITTGSNIPGRISSAPIRLNSAQSRVARDLNGDGEFAQESWLRDSDRNSLSDSLEDELRTNELYYQEDGLQIVGTVQDVLPEKGEMVIVRAYEYCDGTQEMQHPEMTIRFTELSVFEQTNPLAQGILPQRISAHDIEPGLLVSVDCRAQRLAKFDEVVNYWAQRITQYETAEQANSVFFLPALTERRPGQTLNVTVYANDTLFPFHELDRLTLHISGAAEIVPGSINAGYQGGASEDPDGVWSLMGPAPLQLDYTIHPLTEHSDGYGQDFEISIEPQGSLNLTRATGALFNFDLRIYENCSVLAGFHGQDPVAQCRDAQGNLHLWDSPPDEQAVQIVLKALQPELLLLDEALGGSGSVEDPYIVAVNTNYHVQVLDELDGEVTTDPNTWYVVSPAQACYLDYAKPVIRVPAGFSGSFSIHPLYPGNLTIPQQFARSLYFRTP
jgi:hypothetical protein